MTERIVRIGCGAGFWGDSPEGPRQLIESGGIDYLVLDYLAEVTMSILARARQRNPDLGYVTDLIQHVVAPYAARLKRDGIRVVVNAGGLNPEGCRRAIERELARLGIPLSVAAVTGDDLLPRFQALRESGVREMYTGEPLPRSVLSVNAYLGAWPIAAALAAGADIVVTGRCADSALVLGPLIHEFQWREDQHDLLAAGSLAGHVLECGPQCTGGFSTDWQVASESWENIGFPIAECRADGSFVVTKPEGTGGIVSTGTVAEQITYETGDPARYVLPDVVCDFSRVTVRNVGRDRVEVTGARGLPPTPTYKVSATWADGYRCMATLLVKGIDAGAKARAVADAILRRTTRILAREGHAGYSETSVELLGSEHTYGPHARATETREVMLKIGVRHESDQALAVFSREIYPAATATVQGIGGVFGGRPKVQPLVRLFSFLLPKERVTVALHMEGEPRPVANSAGTELPAPAAPPMPEPAFAKTHGGPAGRTVRVPLVRLALARSGDKGDTSNIAVLARRPEYLPFIWTQLTPAAVHAYMAHLMTGHVERFPWPGLNGMNFLLHGALGGGGVASLRYDPQGKGHAQMLLDFMLDIPKHLIDDGDALS